MNKPHTNWKKLKIEYCAEVIGGGTPSTKKKEYWDGDISWITPKDLSNYNNRYISKGSRNISEKGLKYSSARLLPKNSVLLTTRAPIGYLAISKKELATNQGFKSLIMKNGNVPEFFYYLLKNNINKLLQYASGTTFMELNATNLKSIEFYIPEVKEQKRIASILSALDDKIELNNKTNKILEEMAQTIFKEWFINFNFPNEDGKPYKKSGGEMIDSELGKIPKGWKVGTIGDLISNLFNGDWGKDKNKEKYTKEVICIRGADIGDIFKGFDGNPVRRFILEKNLKSKKLLEGDIVMECSGGSPTQSTGRCIFVTKSLLSAYDKPLICTNFCKVIKIKEKEYRGYAYNLLWYLYNTRLFFLFENGTTGIKNLDVNNLFKRHMIAIPDIDVALEYNEIFLSLIDIMHANKKENEKLSNIRDSLLPKLMTPNGRRADGEIRV